MMPRVVLYNQYGRMKGIPQILGTLETWNLVGQDLPASINPIVFPDGHQSEVRLHRKGKSYVGYLEVIP